MGQNEMPVTLSEKVAQLVADELSRRAWSQADGGRTKRSFTRSAVQHRYVKHPGPWVDKAHRNVVWNEAVVATLKKYIKAEQYKAGSDVVTALMWNSITSEMNNLEYPVNGEMRKMVFAPDSCRNKYKKLRGEWEYDMMEM